MRIGGDKCAPVIHPARNASLRGVLFLAGTIVVHSGCARWRSLTGVADSIGRQSEARCGESGLSTSELTITPEDALWVDFLYWVWANGILEYRLEGVSERDTTSPPSGVVLRWAPGSRWEKKTVVSFGFAIGHLAGEYGWRDTHFPQFFDRYGGTYGINIKDRLTLIDPESSEPWKAFFRYLSDPDGPFSRYALHRIAAIEPRQQAVVMVAGQGVAFSYSYDRVLLELRKVLTDCGASEFFELAKRFGRGFASRPGWAGNAVPAEVAFLVYRGSEELSPAKTPAWLSASPTEPRGERQNSRGRMLYEWECSPCHGTTGDRQGPLASALFPRPRNFISGLFRYRSTPTGQLPTDEDLAHAVSRGLPGTAMPAWKQFLKDEEIREIISYMKSFSERFSNEKPGDAIRIPPSQSPTRERIAKGKQVFTDAGCVSCHGEDARGTGKSAKDLKTAEGDPIVARDLTYKWDFRGGYRPEDVFQRLVTGLDGSPMPSYWGMLSEEELWDLVYYVLSLSPLERPRMDLRPSRSERVAR